MKKLIKRLITKHFLKEELIVKTNIIEIGELWQVDYFGNISNNKFGEIKNDNLKYIWYNKTPIATIETHSGNDFTENKPSFSWWDRNRCGAEISKFYPPSLYRGCSNFKTKEEALAESRRILEKEAKNVSEKLKQLEE